jgi:GT2 family glycosyltransferase
LDVQSQPNAKKNLSVRAPTVPVVIPVYNTKDSLRALNDAVRNVTEQTPEIGALQTILVDDGSTDGSWPLIAALRQGIWITSFFDKVTDWPSGFEVIWIALDYPSAF